MNTEDLYLFSWQTSCAFTRTWVDIYVYKVGDLHHIDGPRLRLAC